MKLGAARAKAPGRLAPRRRSRSTRNRPPSPSPSIARSCERSAAAKAAICCAPISPTSDPATLWQYYIQLVAVEEAFKNLKGDLAIRPSSIKTRTRIEAHIFIAFLAYCLHVTLTAPPARPGAGPDRAQCAREVCCRPDDRRSSPDHRRPRTRAHPLHPSRTRAATPDRPAQVPIAAATTAQDRRRRPNQATSVVKTF